MIIKYQNQNWGMTRKQNLYLSQNAILLLFSANRKLMNISWDTCIEKICFEGIVKLQAGMWYTSQFLQKGIANKIRLSCDYMHFKTASPSMFVFYAVQTNSFFSLFMSNFAIQLILKSWLKLFTRALNLCLS